MNELSSLEIENTDVIMRSLDYYSKNLKNLEESELDESMPLFNGQVKDSLLEVELIKEALKSNTDSQLNFVRKRLDFIILVLQFYGNELSEDLEELEDSSDNEHDMNLLEEEIEKINETMQLL